MITIIIPTHNRHEKLDRAINYYSEFDSQIIVVDSSEVIYERNYPSNVRYLYKPTLNFAEKILTAVRDCDNELVALVADDDFILEKPLFKAVTRMKQAEEISISFGYFLSFNEGNVSSLEPIPVLNRNPDYYHGVANAESKLKHFVANFEQLLWSLYRKETLLSAFKKVAKADYVNDNFIELTIATTAFSKGTVNHTNSFWGVRERALGEHWGSRHKAISKNDPLEFTKFIDSGENDFEKKLCQVALEHYLSKSLSRKVRHRISRFRKPISHGSIDYTLSEILSILNKAHE
ncbi:TIGR00180 family glycosyltransferase [Alginatibacterium sediminis]|uniref:TIGR00180 family glycosyltransferase n=1 Tax=Alginatibacterium sediminis TaxID=2164068 RepID=A0A420EAZ1_9ALTE|nr:TIGR00180 family glycosyltransferase [Alginatibacterium sediminis]RKF17823.1 TIGR00180 family glycosyltransferase [Alginatibacterium sediminis]